jgi:class 3 adenylate cyclase/tetratricopeptide (TPR) repeat protein
MTCGSCGSPTPDGAWFCPQCGSPQSLACRACGRDLTAGARFCGWCGAAVSGAPRPDAPVAEAGRASAGPLPVAERRVTSILFGDLVGFTALSEVRDAEEVRELLSEYFQHSRETVARYGGTIEKFIGDAVMAVWGVPVAHEDDAERAVRAGMELVEAVADFGERAGAPGLALRVGIVTGEVAVTLGARGEGMVAGDAVNTAARVQAQARPGTVWVDRQTRSLTEAAAECKSAGVHTLKGKREPMALFEVVAVSEARGGGRRSWVEAPLVGRSRALGVMKETFHAAGEQDRGLLLIVSGEPGVGKTRLARELHEYVDGLTDVVRWHWGRALAYGDGVAFSPLSAALAGRVGVTPDDDAAAITAKLAGSLRELVADATERAWLQPRLAVLLGTAADRQFSGGELFAAWLAWFETLGADGTPVVWVIDDAHHADDGVLDFADHLATSPRSTVVNLEGLPAGAMTRLVNQLVGDLPPVVVERLVERAEGIPLYAVEIIRGMRDRGLLVAGPDGRGLVPASEPQQLATTTAPTSLRVLISSRLDALSPDDRTLLGSAAVLGTSFPVEALSALTGTAATALVGTLQTLVHRDLLRIDSDRLSAENGQYAFVQTLVREVAYQTQSRRDRAARHLAAARYLETVAEDGGQLAAVIAGHLTDASELVPATAPQRADLRAEAASWHEKAGDRARALGAPSDALASYETALGQASEPATLARLRLAAADAAIVAGRYERAISHAEAVGRDEPAALVARADAARGQAHRRLGQNADAVRLLTPWLDRLAELPPAEASDLARELAFSMHQLGELAGAVPIGERAMELARQSGRADLIARAWNVLAVHKDIGGDWRAARVLYTQAAEFARERGLTTELGFILQNLSAIDLVRDLAAGIRTAREALDLAQQTGHTSQANYAATNLIEGLRTVGRWDEAIAVSAERVIGDSIATGLLDVHQIGLDLGLIALARDEAPPAITFRHTAGPAFATGDPGVDPMEIALQAAARGDFGAAFDVAHPDLLAKLERAGRDEEFTVTWTATADWGVDAGRYDELPAVLALVQDAPPDQVTPVLAAQLLRLRGTTAASAAARNAAADRAGAGAEADLRAAIVGLGDLGAVPYLACAQAALGGWLQVRERHDDAAPLLESARRTFEALRARRWLARLDSPRGGWLAPPATT